MIKIVENEKEIREYHLFFHKTIDKYFSKKINCFVGYPGGSFEDNVRYSPDLNIWISVQELDNRYWNGFGVGKPIAGASNSLWGEINFNYKGIKRIIAGVFGVDLSGNVMVLHRGRIKGVKSFFMDNFRGDFVTAIDGDRETQFCLVGELNSKYFLEQLSNFIHEIHRIKHLNYENSTGFFDKLNSFSFTKEHHGESVCERDNPVVIKRVHGIIVNALASKLLNMGFKIGNDRNRDLFIHENGKICMLFEIKTSSSTQGLSSAIGQLLLYSIPINNPLKLIVVLPDFLSIVVERKFLELGILPLYYKWENNIPVFLDLETILT
jgi:hypothetical protein